MPVNFGFFQPAPLCSKLDSGFRRGDIAANEAQLKSKDQRGCHCGFCEPLKLKVKRHDVGQDFNSRCGETEEIINRETKS
jgi:hypothetical protein